MPTETKFVIIKESIFASIVTDIVRFGAIFATMYLNHLYLEGSVIIDVLLMLCVMVSIGSYKTRNRLTSEQAIAYLKEHKSPKFQLMFHLADKKTGRVIESFDSYDEAMSRKAFLKDPDGCELHIGTSKIKG